ncbi:insulinase family protein [Acinetobacter larvae]|uniref:Peptidase M16C associated domain-containing protein n=1 Tax=Acinetobacter larvae TaxID=1789224 RepID=A0A1B2M091_9GAMM|nr:insulinase family protein [Acinetobacter larvae]AOA58617.1 hypothetical protein BFG52_09810 [Acinetobacter larvae]
MSQSIDAVSNFILLKQHHIAALALDVQLYQHRETGLQHYHFADGAAEYCLMIMLKTQPDSSNGVAHVLEHTVLNGSKKYPIRNVFTAMAQRSVNHFMNAFTDADYTCYPFATSNPQDFKNLADVYLDAVFAANLDPLDFQQEGIRIDFEQQQAQFKGIVFNEMKGAMSVVDRALYSEVQQHIFAGSCYAYNSGGNPLEIATLRYQQLQDFYQRYYHPSNALVFSAGDIDLTLLHHQLQQKIAHRHAVAAALPQFAPRRNVPMYRQASFPAQDTTQKSYIQMAWLLAPSADLLLNLAWYVLAELLCGRADAPLRHYCDHFAAGALSSSLMGLVDQTTESVFHCGIQQVDASAVSAFEDGVWRVLQDFMRDPIDDQLLDSIMTRLEFEQREVRSGPYALSLFFKAARYAAIDADVFAALDLSATLAQLRLKVQDHVWLKSLLQQGLIDNPHRLCLLYQPDPAQLAQQQLAEQALLQKMTAQLNTVQRKQLQQQAQALQQRQQQPQDASVLPKLEISDLSLQSKEYPCQRSVIQLKQQEAACYAYAAGRNGVFDLQISFVLSEEIYLHPLFEFYQDLFGQLGAGESSYQQIELAVQAQSAGLSTELQSYIKVEDQQQQCAVRLSFAIKALAQQHQAIALLQQVLEQQRFDEPERLIHVLERNIQFKQSNINHFAATIATSSACRHFNPSAAYDYKSNALQSLQRQQQWLKQLQQDEHAVALLMSQLRQLHRQVLHCPRHFILVCDADVQAELLAQLEQQWQGYQSLALVEGIEQTVPQHSMAAEEQAWLIDGQVNYCVQAYPAVPIEHPDAAIFMVLAHYLTEGYLFNAIRQQGGAYDGRARYVEHSAALHLSSFRDPQLERTYQHFQQAIDNVCHRTVDHALLEAAILKASSSLNRHGLPLQQVLEQHADDWRGHTQHHDQLINQRILKVTYADLQRVCQQYLTPQSASRAALAGQQQAAALAQLGFQVCALSKHEALT